MFMKFQQLITCLSVVGWSLTALAADPVLTAVRVQGNGPILDVNAAAWNDAPVMKVSLYQQNVVLPHNVNPAVNEIKVKATHNGQWLALLMEWADPSESNRLVTDQFGDQIAVELPIDANSAASPMMGNPKGRVNILQWRAVMQHDLDKGDVKLHDLYPNALVDVYPDQVLRATDATPYSGALGLDNPVSRPHNSPVLDQMAEGWSTLTIKPDQQADGRGVWEKGVWKVIITTPLSSASKNAPHLSPSDATQVAFAVWEGGKGEVGSRKSWSNWLPLQLAP
jgi:hypothetical protein